MEVRKEEKKRKADKRKTKKDSNRKTKKDSKPKTKKDSKRKIKKIKEDSGIAKKAKLEVRVVVTSVAVNPTNPVLSDVAASLPVAAPPVYIVVQHQAAPPAPTYLPVAAPPVSIVVQYQAAPSAPAAIPVAAPPMSIVVQHQATPPAAVAVVAPSVATNALGSLNEFEDFLLDLDLESGP